MGEAKRRGTRDDRIWQAELQAQLRRDEEAKARAEARARHEAEQVALAADRARRAQELAAAPAAAPQPPRHGMSSAFRSGPRSRSHSLMALAAMFMLSNPAQADPRRKS